MKISINRSLINALYDNAAQNATMLKAALGANDEIPKREDLVTGAVKKCGVATIMVTEVEVVIEIPDDFFIDTMRLQSNAIPLFAPVIGSTIGAMKIFKGMTQSYKDKWFPKTEAELKQEEARKREMSIRRATETEMAAFEAGRQHASREFVLHGALADLKIPGEEGTDSTEPAITDKPEDIVFIHRELDDETNVESATEMAIPLDYDRDNDECTVEIRRRVGGKVYRKMWVLVKDLASFVGHSCLSMPVLRSSNGIVLAKTSDHMYTVRLAPFGRVEVDMRFTPADMMLILENLGVLCSSTRTRLMEEQATRDAAQLEN